MTQTALPQMDETEMARFFVPYGEKAYEHPIKTGEWTHVASARFGEGRNCGWNNETKWSGDSYRYDIFKMGGDGPHFNFYALRWCNGSGKGWLLVDDKARRGEGCLLCYLATVADEGQRWDYCHFLWETAIKNEMAGQEKATERMKSAYAEGRIRKTKRGIEVRPKIETVKATLPTAVEA